MKDIGFYAGFLKPAEQEAVRNASIWQLTDALDDMARDIYLNCALNEVNSNDDYSLEIDWESLSDRDKVALIRGLCDAIELKLMEGAK